MYQPRPPPKVPRPPPRPPSAPRAPRAPPAPSRAARPPPVVPSRVPTPPSRVPSRPFSVPTPPLAPRPPTAKARPPSLPLNPRPPMQPRMTPGTAGTPRSMNTTLSTQTSFVNTEQLGADADKTTVTTRVCTGWLLKKGSLRKSWKRRFFVLYSNNKMDYFDDENAKSSKGEIDLRRAKSYNLSEEKEFAFELLCDKRRWVFAADDADTRAMWMQIFQQVVGVEVASGWLFKRNKRQGAWKKRFVLLRNNGKLQCFSDATCKELLVTVSLADAQYVEQDLEFRCLSSTIPDDDGTAMTGADESVKNTVTQWHRDVFRLQHMRGDSLESLSSTVLAQDGRTVDMPLVYTLTLVMRNATWYLGSDSAAVQARFVTALARVYANTTGNKARFLRPAIQGHLHKQGARIRNWKRRYFALSSDGKYLFYFPDETAFHKYAKIAFLAPTTDLNELKLKHLVIGIIPLYGSIVLQVSSFDPRKFDNDACFTVEVPLRRYKFVAPGEEATLRWVETLRQPVKTCDLSKRGSVVAANARSRLQAREVAPDALTVPLSGSNAESAEAAQSEEFDYDDDDDDDDDDSDDEVLERGRSMTVSQFEHGEPDEDAYTNMMRVSNEIVDSEKTYVKGIAALQRHYVDRLAAMEALGRPILDADEIASIFLNIGNIVQLNTKLCDDLEDARRRMENLPVKVGEIIRGFAPFLQLYSVYVTQYGAATQALEQVQARNSRFDEMVRVNERVLGTTLLSLMIMPVQRIPRYLLLLNELKKQAGKAHVQIAGLNDTLTELKRIADAVNQNVHGNEARQQVVNLQEQLFRGKVDLVTPTRFLVMRAELQKVWNNQRLRRRAARTYLFFLFNDILLYATPVGDDTRTKTSKDLANEGKDIYGSAKVKHVLPLAGLTVEEVPNSRDWQNAMHIRSSTKSFTLACPSAEERTLWVKQLRRYAKICTDNLNSLERQQQVSGWDIEKIIKKQK
ncbi:MAG: hypothetical protein MHM6MM_003138 [Cercozoa sp. M6MM]